MRRAIIVLLAVLVPATTQAQQAQTADSVSLPQRVQTLAQLWREVSYNFAYFDHVPDLDWDAQFVATLPAAQAAGSTFEFYRVLQRFFAELHDGHTQIFFPDSIIKRRPIDLPPVELEEIAHRAFVSNVDSALAATLPLGSEILTVESLSVSEHLAKFVFPLMAVSSEHVRWRDAIRGNTGQMLGLLAGPAGSQVQVTARTPRGDVTEVVLTRDRASRRPRWLVQPRPKPLLEHRVLADDIDYVALNSFNDPALVPQFDSLMPRLLRSKGVIIDVRRNGGGVDDVVKQILTRLTADTLLGPAWRTRIHNATYKAWGRFANEQSWAEQYRPYWQDNAWYIGAPDTVAPAGNRTLTSRIVVLTGSQTASAAENFLVYIHHQRRFTLVGQPTNGSSGQPLMIDLPAGGRAWICTKRNTYPNGQTYIGSGVIPDVVVPITVEDVRAGRDRTLEQAIKLLRQESLSR